MPAGRLERRLQSVQAEATDVGADHGIPVDRA
jgi:hypothetical protein